MKNRMFIFFLLLCPLSGFSQQSISGDTVIRKMVGQVSKDSLQSYIQTLVSFKTRHTLSNQTDADYGIGAARNWVLRKFREAAAHSRGRMTAKIDFWQQPADKHRVDRPIRMGNVMAILKGTDSKDNRVFIVTAHLDSRNTHIMDSTGAAPGANDDGSGVAALIEMVRIMSRYPAKADILFVAVTGEEQGLLGAKHLAAKAKEQNRNVAAMINNDMIGQSTSSGTAKHNNLKVRVFSEGIPYLETPEEVALRKALGGENDSPSREFARYIKHMAEEYIDNLTVKLIYRRDRFLRGGDHLPFQKNGYTAVRITDFLENYDHQHQDLRKEEGIEYGDLQKFMDFGYLRKNTSLNLATLAALANAPSLPENAKIDVSHLTNYTRLYWQSPQFGAVKGYYILMRETSAPMWQKRFYTEKTEIKLPYSKDNYFFGVQAVGENGLLSLPVFPGIGR